MTTHSSSAPTRWYNGQFVREADLSSSGQPSQEVTDEQQARYLESVKQRQWEIAFWGGNPPAEGASWGVRVDIDAKGIKHYIAFAQAECSAFGTQEARSKKFAEKRIALDEADPPIVGAFERPSQELRERQVAAAATIAATMDKKKYASPSMIRTIARDLRDQVYLLQKQWAREETAFYMEARMRAEALDRIDGFIRDVKLFATDEQRKHLHSLLVSVAEQ